jgi:hypothetical protein
MTVRQPIEQFSSCSMAHGRYLAARNGRRQQLQALSCAGVQVNPVTMAPTASEGVSSRQLVPPKAQRQFLQLCRLEVVIVSVSATRGIIKVAHSPHERRLDDVEVLREVRYTLSRVTALVLTERVGTRA